MSFLKIDDPAKRDLIVKEYLETKKNIRSNQLAERMGEIELQSDLSKFFKPITETQIATTRKIMEGLIPIEEGIEGLQKTIELPSYPPMKISTSKEGKVTIREGDEIQTIGPIAHKYLMRFANKADVDKTYGLHSKKGKFYISNKLAIIVDNDIVVCNSEYEGTPGLWELITSKHPDKNIYTDNDYDNYKDLMIKTNTLYRNYDPTTNRANSNKGAKWNKLLKHIWSDIKFGEGIIIPCDPNALLQRLELLIASKAAGNTGVRNEIVSVCDELKSQGYFDEKSYKKLMSIL